MDDIEYKEDLLKIPVEKVYNKYIIVGDVWYFNDKCGKNWFGIYDQFKQLILNKLEAHYNDIAIDGSAKLGFSLNPTKNFRLFNKESDIDIIVISRKFENLFNIKKTMQKNKNKTERKEVADMLRIKINAAGKVAFKNEEEVSRLLRYLCFKVFKDDETKELFEANNVTRLLL